MAQRRNNRNRRRRGRFGFLYKALSTILILAAITAGCAVFFQIRAITVAGNVRYTTEEVIEATGVEPGSNLFLLNKYQLARRLLVELPYIDEITIRRRLPDTLVLTITECVPVAAVRSGTDWWLIDAKGKLLEQVSESTGSNYAAVSGISPILPMAGTKMAAGDEGRNKLQSLIQLLTALQERNMADKVSQIDLSDAATLTLRYDGRLTVLLPMSGDFSRNVWRLAEVVKLLESNESGTLDLTGEKGYFRPD